MSGSLARKALPAHLTLGDGMPGEVQRWPTGFVEKIAFGPDCWEWTASVSNRGYGRYGIGRPKWTGAHRFAYALANGPIPTGLTIDHLCRNRRCVNPAHLEAVTNYENLLRGNTIVALAATTTHCRRGHPYAGNNLHLGYSPWGRPTRRCRECRRIARAARQAVA